jgi:hypothetical protein
MGSSIGVAGVCSVDPGDWATAGVAPKPVIVAESRTAQISRAVDVLVRIGPLHSASVTTAGLGEGPSRTDILLP